MWAIDIYAHFNYCLYIKQLTDLKIEYIELNKPLNVGTYYWKLSNFW